MDNILDRRRFIGIAVAAITGGCLSNTSGRSTDSSDPVEMGGIELANIQPQPLESYVGISATVYNSTPNEATVTVQFTAYDNSGTTLHEGTDAVTVPSKSQAPISKYWEKNPDNDPFQGWDAAIVSAETG